MNILLARSTLISRFRTLRQKGQMPHAILLVGPRGTQKMLLAREIARIMSPESEHALLKNTAENIVTLGKLWQKNICENWEEISKTSNCDQQHRKEKGSRTNTIGVDDISHFLHTLFQKTEASAKIGILAEADRMTIEAANSLLKILEEPPEKTTFILTAHHFRLLPATILSRCQLFFVPLLSRNLLQKALLEHGISEKKTEEILTLAQGRPENVLRLMKDEYFLEEERSHFQEIARLLHTNMAERWKKAEELATPENRKKLEIFLENMSRFLRSLLLEKVNKKDLPLANALSYSHIINLTKALFEVSKNLSTNANRRLLLEDFFCRFPEGLDFSSKKRKNSEDFFDAFL